MLKKFSLNQLCILITDGSHFSPQGINNGIPMYSVKDMNYYGFNSFNVKKISKEDYLNLKKSGCEPMDGDVLVAKDGSVMKHVFKYKQKEKCILLSSIAILRPNKEIIDPDFLVYLLLNPNTKKNVINNYVSGSGVPRIVLKDFKKIQFEIIDLNLQKKTSTFLNMLKEKIELNLKINQNLKVICEQLYKSWFVDFEPVRIKNNESTLKNFKEIKDLFPSDFNKNELRKIPSGWKIKKLGEVLLFLGSGMRPKGGASVSENQIPSIGAENINFIGSYDYTKVKYIPLNFYEKLKKKEVQIKDYDILIYKDGANIGRSTIFGKNFPHKECTINEHVHLVRTKQFIQKYLYFYLSTKKTQQELISLNTASAQPGINQTQLKTLEVLIPDEKVLKKFDEIVTPLIDRIFNNCLQNRYLEELRDTILPKLLKGELKIDDLQMDISKAMV